jgi:hypothetical protein
LDVGCFTELCWCNINHDGRSVKGFGMEVKQAQGGQKSFAGSPSLLCL